MSHKRSRAEIESTIRHIVELWDDVLRDIDRIGQRANAINQEIASLHQQIHAQKEIIRQQEETRAQIEAIMRSEDLDRMEYDYD